MAAAHLLQKIQEMNGQKYRYVYLPPLPKEPVPFISIDVAQRMKMDAQVKQVALKMGFTPLPTDIPCYPMAISNEIRIR